MEKRECGNNAGLTKAAAGGLAGRLADYALYLSSGETARVGAGANKTAAFRLLFYTTLNQTEM
jgi:hypothetical protein